MGEHYETWSQDLFYGSEVSSTTSVNAENDYSPMRLQRFRAVRNSPIQSISPIQLTPSVSRSPLQALKQTPEGMLYSSYEPQV